MGQNCSKDKEPQEENVMIPEEAEEDEEPEVIESNEALEKEASEAASAISNLTVSCLATGANVSP